MQIFIIFFIYINNTKYNIYIYNTKWAGLVRPNRLGRTQPKIVGPISAQNGLGRSRPKRLFWARPGPEDRAGPAHPTGPDSVQNCWADFGPQWIGPRSAQNKNSSGPDPAQKTRLGQDPPGPATKTGGGNYFPPAPACRTLIVLHEEKKRKK